MANAYVSTTGSAAYPGTVNAPTSLGTALSTAAAGDVVYLAPGVYRGTFTLTVSGTSGNVITFIGDVTNSLSWAGASAGEVRITNYGSDTANPTAVTNGTLEATSRNYVTFQNLVFECYGVSFRSGAVYITSCTYFSFISCSFKSVSASGLRINCSAVSNITLNRCSGIATDAPYNFLVFVQATSGSNYDTAITINSCLAIRSGLLWFDASGGQLSTTAGGYKVINSTSLGGDYGVRSYTTNTAHPSSITNCFIMGITGSMLNGTTAVVTQTYNVYFAGLTNIATSVTSSAVGVIPINVGEVNMQGYGSLPIIAPYITSRLRAFGTATGAPATDLYNNAWSGVTPDAGGLTYVQQGNSAYFPSERNASTITIAPGSTSQSIELYLGATGLTASTAGLSARYNRTRTASVNIPLVARTIGQAWISGGFAEVDAVNMPGIYRVDIPDAALAVGADDVTLVVRGASGTNGAVMTIKLSSGGLTSAETASAVWGASVAGYVTGTDFGGVINETRNVVGSTETYVLDVPNQVWEELTVNHDTHGTYGWNVLRADAPSKEGLVTLHQSGGVSRVDADIHAIVNDADAASELKGALLHNGTDYISANLLTPTSPATLLRMGPYSVVADQSKQEINIDILTGSSLPVVLQLVDVTGTGIPLVGATLSVKIYNASGTLVTTYTGTASYSDAGFLTFTLDSVVTANPGTYYLTVTRTTGATDTSIYGGLRLYVRSN